MEDHDESTMGKDARFANARTPRVPSSSSLCSVVCHRLKENWKVILLGQSLSFLLASAGAAQATLHLSCGLSAPTFTMALVYLGLSILHLPILVWKKRQECCCLPWQKAERLPTHESDAISSHPQFGDAEERIQTFDHDESHRNDSAQNNNEHALADSSVANNNENNNSNDKPFFFWSLWWYLLLAFFDVEANAVTMLAFRYTTLTSVTLFDALAIPAAMIISRCVVFRTSRRYRALHYVGVLVCMVGVCLNVFQDYESDVDAAQTENETKNETATEIEEEYPHKLWGDLCAITGGILYGLNDVLTEVTVSKAGGTTEYLGVLGVFGFLISLVQSLLLEREHIQEFFLVGNALGNGSSFDSGDDSMNDATCSLQSGFLLLFAFVGVTICSYVGGSHFLILSEAAFFNLSLLTGDLWSVLFSVVAERIVPRPLFFAALVAVLSGVVLYEMAPSPALEKEETLHEDGNWVVVNDEPFGNGKDGLMVVNDHQRSSCSSDSDYDETDATGLELNGISIT